MLIRIVLASALIALNIIELEIMFNATWITDGVFHKNMVSYRQEEAVMLQGWSKDLGSPKSG